MKDGGASIRPEPLRVKMGVCFRRVVASVAVVTTVVFWSVSAAANSYIFSSAWRINGEVGVGGRSPNKWIRLVQATAEIPPQTNIGSGLPLDTYPEAREHRDSAKSPPSSDRTTEIPPVITPSDSGAASERASVSGASGNNASAVKNRFIPDTGQEEEHPVHAVDAASPAALPGLADVNEFLSDHDYVSPLGLQLREARAKLANGHTVDGLAVIKVMPDSPAAQAGIRPLHDMPHRVLDGALLAAAMVFPPAIVALALTDQTQIGESFDLIIGIDGKRVDNILDFEDEVHYAQPGGIVYLNVVRDGKRIQIPVRLPAEVSRKEPLQSGRGK